MNIIASQATKALNEVQKSTTLKMPGLAYLGFFRQICTQHALMTAPANAPMSKVYMLKILLQASFSTDGGRRMSLDTL